MAEYQTIFKCRLCGKLYKGIATGNEKVALETIVDACLGIESAVIQAPHLKEAHFCADGSYGVADFYGYEKIN